MALCVSQTGPNRVTKRSQCHKRVHKPPPMAKLLGMVSFKENVMAENTWKGCMHQPRGDGNRNARHANLIPYRHGLGYKDIPQPAADSPYARRHNRVPRRTKSLRPSSHHQQAKGHGSLDAEVGRSQHGKTECYSHTCW